MCSPSAAITATAAPPRCVHGIHCPLLPLLSLSSLLFSSFVCDAGFSWRVGSVACARSSIHEDVRCIASVLRALSSHTSEKSRSCPLLLTPHTPTLFASCFPHLLTPLTASVSPLTLPPAKREKKRQKKIFPRSFEPEACQTTLPNAFHHLCLARFACHLFFFFSCKTHLVWFTGQGDQALPRAQHCRLLCHQGSCGG